MFDNLLMIGTTFDWISPLIAYAKDLAYGPSHTFLVHEDAGWSGREIERVLQQHGVKVWGLMTVSDTLMFTVRQAQARWAEYVLLRAGVPLASRTVSQGTSRRGRLARSDGDSDPLQTVDTWLDNFGNRLGL